MQRLIKSSLVLMMTIIIVLSHPLPILSASYSQPSANRYDFECTNINILTDNVREENEFKVGATINYYAINTGYWYQPPDVWIQCPDCNGNGHCVCSSCGGRGGRYEWIYVICHPGNLCQPGCDGTYYKCRYCDYIASAHNNNCPIHGNHCAIPAHKCTCYAQNKENVWRSCSRCGGTGKVTCSTCGGTGGHYETPPMEWIPPSRPSAGTTQVNFLIDGKVQITQDITIQIDRENASTSSGGTGWEVWGTAYVEVELNPGENIGNKNVEARINWDYKNREINTNNNSKSTTINVIPATNLQVEMIPPNASYRTNTDVVTTYRIINKDDIGELNVRPKHNLTAVFKALNSTTGDVISTSKVEGIVIPKQGTNIVFYKWHVPDDYNLNNIKIQCEINTTKGVNETNYTDNICAGTNEVQKYRAMETPDTIFENRPNGFITPIGDEKSQYKIISNNVMDNASWEVWEWDKKTDWYIKNTYGLAVKTTQEILPDVNSPSKEFITAKDMWQIRSGYGFSLKATTIIDNNGYTLPGENAYTTIQHANAYFPEYRYQGDYKKFRTLERTNSNTFEFEINPNTKNDKGKQDFRRIHFSPLWYPDGEYKVKTYVYDLWSPGGMQSVATDIKPILINGDMYDDWFVNHSEKKD